VTADFAFLVEIAGRHRLEVGAGAEIAAGAGEHRDRRLDVGVERQKRIEQFSRGGAIDGVTAMRTMMETMVTGPSRSTSTVSASVMALGLPSVFPGGSFAPRMMPRQEWGPSQPDGQITESCPAPL